MCLAAPKLDSSHRGGKFCWTAGVCRTGRVMCRGSPGALHCPGPHARGWPCSTWPLPASSSGSFPASSAAPTSTSYRTMTGRPFLPGSTASASVGSSWCPPCSTQSPGRRATLGTCCPAHGRGRCAGQGDQGRVMRQDAEFAADTQPIANVC